MIIHVLGARPNFPKAAPVIRALDDLDAQQQVIHTGQHYDRQMSDVFFEQLGLPTPDVNLNVGSGTHATQTAAVMLGLEGYVIRESPTLIVVYGDVNSTVAATLVAVKLGIPVAHVESGLRSFDRSMPEEINRLIVDRLADLLFVTSPEAIGQLAREGVAPESIHFVGNTMVDTLLSRHQEFDVAAATCDLGLVGPYAMATLHRPVNVDDQGSVARLIEALHSVADLIQIVLPLHPRGRDRLIGAGLDNHPRIRVCDPLDYIQFLSLVRGATAVITDSGGVQEESTMLGVPCLTVRDSTERPITVTHGTNRLVKVDQLVREVKAVIVRPMATEWSVPPLWDGKSGKRIAEIIVEWTRCRGSLDS